MNSFLLEKCEQLPDIQSEGYIYRHIKSGARLIYIKNDDDNKVFSIAFRTPSNNSTGIQHIIEHSTLCGSRKYPAKDPFVELAKGSLNTFLNAMTFPDKTIYPVASVNDKDFKNLMDVYLDAVFFPKIHNEEKIFKQEGWHYEYDGKDLIYNGVVFNEMKGAYSDPDSILSDNIRASLFPDTTYRHDSGGNPKEIPNLTYDDFMDYHINHYNPKNSYIYLYGKMDIEEILSYLDNEYLSHFDKDDFSLDTSIASQKAFTEAVDRSFYYPILKEDASKDKTYLSYSWIVGESTDAKLVLAMEALDYLLISAPGAILKEALINKGISTDIYSIYEAEIKQPTYSIIAKNTNPADKELFISTIYEVLEDIVKKGFDEEMLEAGLNCFEFKYREADFNRYPKGLIFNLSLMDSWLYDDNKPFVHLDLNKIFDEFRSIDKKAYFTDIIKNFLIKNKSAASVSLIPDIDLEEKDRREEIAKLDKYKASLSETELAFIQKETQRLKAYQAEPSTKEDLDLIPLLSLEDLDKKAKEIKYCEEDFEGIKVISEDIFTNSIAYFTLSFSVKNVREDLLPYLGILNSIIGLVDTKNYSYADFTSAINLTTGGIFTDLSIRRQVNNPKDFTIGLNVRAKSLYMYINKLLSLTEEMLVRSDFSDKKRLKELLSEQVSQMDGGILSAGHATAVSIGLAQISPAAYYSSLMGGYNFYLFLQKLVNNFDTEADDIINKLNELVKLVFNKNNITVNITADKDGIELSKKELKNILNSLDESPVNKVERTFKEASISNIALTSTSKVQFVARTGNFKEKGLPYTGALKVLKTILSYDYLWLNVRVQNGAYGAMCSFDRSGDAFLVSYRDPKLVETNNIFEGTSTFLRDFNISEKEMTKYIIGTIGAMDTPLNPVYEGYRAFEAYLTGATTDMLQKERDQVLLADNKSIQALAPYIDALLNNNCLTVVGNVDTITKESKLFNEIKPYNKISK